MQGCRLCSETSDPSELITCHRKSCKAHYHPKCLGEGAGGEGRLDCPMHVCAACNLGEMFGV